jgi:flagellin
MPQVINTNVMSLNSQRHLNRSQMSMATALERLSSGLRINSAKDDAAGLAISERQTAQIRGINQGVRNASDAISLAQTAEGSIQEITSALQRIRELAVQAKNATNSQSDRTSLNEEAKQLKAEIQRVAGTQYNGVNIVGTGATNFKFQVGAYASNTITISTQNVLTIAGAASGGSGVLNLLSASGGVSSVAGASKLIVKLDVYLDSVNSFRAKLGAVQNRFESVIRNGQNVSENLSAARSRIVDADFAQETAALTRAQILQQAGTAMLAQANGLPQNALTLLRG